jgi:hypothetical protein
MVQTGRHSIRNAELSRHAASSLGVLAASNAAMNRLHLIDREIDHAHEHLSLIRFGILAA